MTQPSDEAPGAVPPALAPALAIPQRHAVWEDVYGVATGCLLLALGVHLLHQARLITGGMAGLALLLSYVVPVSPGTLFAVLNLPIFLAFWRSQGTPYTLRSLVATLGISGLVSLVGAGLVLSAASPAAVAVVAGTVLGMGLLAVTRHGTAVGGSSVIARALSLSKGWSFGRLLMITDACIITASAFVLGPERAVWSLVSAVCANLMVMTWHRPDRYLAESL